MRLNVKGLALAGGFLWGAAILGVAVANLIWPPYGAAFLQVMASVYPGYSGERHVQQVLIGTGYALVDGGVAGALMAWLYNRLSAG